MFLDRAPGSGPMQTIDFTGPQPGVRQTFRSRESHASNGGGIRTADIVERMALRRQGGARNAFVLDPQVEFDELYSKMVKQGASDADATQAALARVRASVDRVCSEPGMAKLAGRIQAQFSTLLTRIQEMDNMIPPGASRPSDNFTAKQGARIAGMGAPPRPPTAPRVASQDVVTFDYTSVDGNTYTLAKSRGGNIEPGLFPLLSILAAREAGLGGDWSTPIAACGLKVQDINGQDIIHPDHFVVAQEEPSELPGGVSMDD